MSRSKNRVIRIVGTAAALAVAALTPLVPLTQPAPAAAAVIGEGPNQEIRNQHSTMCLESPGFGAGSGAEARQWTCLEGQNQLWEVRDLGNDFAEIRNRNTGLCLDGVGTDVGAPVGLYGCHGGANQQWRMVDAGWGWTRVVNRASNHCLDNLGFGNTDGARVVQWSCNDASAQRWKLTDPNVQKVTYHLNQSANPSDDERDAYARITDAMNRAVARWNRHNNTQRHLTVNYDPGVQTADGNINGNIRFGSNRGFMQEGTALHEMAHTMGVGTAWNWGGKCDAQDWPSALPLLRTFDGPDARINCGGGHFWPYGLNYSNEYSEINFERHVKLVQAMHHDGL